jgi:hypothetical protein
MGIQIKDGNWLNVFNPRIYDNGWKNIFRGQIYDNGWKTFYVRLTPVVPTVSNVSRTTTTLTFRYTHPGDTETNSPVRIEYRLKNNAGTVVRSGSETFASGAINQTVEFTGLASNATFSFEARAVYTDHNIETDYSNPVSRTTSITTVAPSVFVVNRQLNSLTFRYTHPGDTQANTPVSITYYLIENSTLQTVRGPTTSVQTTGSIDVTLSAYTSLASNTDYTFVAQANYPTYGLTSATGTVGTTTLAPAPTYTMLPSTTSFSRGGNVRLDVTTTNVASGTLLYWSAINNNSNDQYNEFVSSQGTVTIQGGAGQFFVLTRFLNVTPHLFLQRTSTKENLLRYRATTLSFPNDGYVSAFRGQAKFKVKLYTDSDRTNEVRSTSDITISVEPYSLRVTFTSTSNTNPVYNIPTSGVVTTTVNDVRNTPGLPPLTNYDVKATTRYTSRVPEVEIDHINQATTIRRPTTPTAVVNNSQGSVRVTAISGTNSRAGTARIEFELQNAANGSVIETRQSANINVSHGNNQSRSVIFSNLQLAITYRVRARTVYPNYGPAISNYSAYSTNFGLTFNP